eukprot:3524777-Amphidinium_carterae.2
MPTSPVAALDGHTILPHLFTDTYLTLHDTLVEVQSQPHENTGLVRQPRDLEPEAQDVPLPQFEDMDPVEETERVGDLPYKCNLCDRAFKQFNGLSTHKRRTHRLFPPLALRIRGTQCVVCKSQLSTRRHLIEHLNNRMECALPTLQLLQPMTEEEYAKDIGRLQNEDASLTRDIAPRTGPIRKVCNVPVSEGVAIVNPFAHTDAGLTPA